jgi:nicotinamidase-related amidase
MIRLRNLLIIIDMQYDFCEPGEALYVNGAEKDVKRLAEFIVQNNEKIDHIVLTQDNHHVIDISHPAFWIDRKGNHPVPFTIITTGDVKNKVWTPVYYVNEASHYIDELENQSEFPHTIWPEHCIIGSKGAAIVDEIIDPIKEWARKGRFYEIVIKGTNPLTEHFGALRANIPNKLAPETQLNQNLVDSLVKYEHIFIAGEARSHCVANTVKQMLEINGIAEKLVVLWDCMSNVTGFERIADPIYDEAIKSGVKIGHAGLVKLN